MIFLKFVPTYARTAGRRLIECLLGVVTVKDLVEDSLEFHCLCIPKVTEHYLIFVAGKLLHGGIASRLGDLDSFRGFKILGTGFTERRLK